MARKTAKEKAVDNFVNDIFSLSNKCKSINETNKLLITQYCRFVIICDEISKKIFVSSNNEDFDNLVKNYEKLSKIILNLYKALSFDEIEEDIKECNNKYADLMLENQEGDDF